MRLVLHLAKDSDLLADVVCNRAEVTSSFFGSTAPGLDIPADICGYPPVLADEILKFLSLRWLPSLDSGRRGLPLQGRQAAF